MITAEEARKKVEEYNSRYLQKDLAETKIMEAIAQGKKSCWLGIRIGDRTVKWLESLGYTVRIERITRSESDADTRVLW
ncbi:MAG: hypothetical protein IJ223_01720 [Clostridia bacterium]|nr:hypothetical protein [Clostridia bacterium]